MSNSNINNLLKFCEFIYKLREVERVMYRYISDRKENDAEHSYQLAMVCWYIIDIYSLQLDLNLVLKYCLAHDLVEIYAGDTYIFGDSQDLSKKSHNEHIALLKIQEEFLEFKDLFVIINNYEARIDEESKFVYAVDKIVTPINIYNSGGVQRKEGKISLDMLLTNKDSKIAMHDDVYDIWSQIKELFFQNKDLFYHN